MEQTNGRDVFNRISLGHLNSNVSQTSAQAASPVSLAPITYMLCSVPCMSIKETNEV